MEVDQDIPAVLATLRSETSDDLAPAFYQFEDLWERKLWHQLTSDLIAFYSDVRSEPIRYRLFTQFVATFQDKINQLSLVRLGISASHQCSDQSEALSFLSGLASKVKPSPVPENEESFRSQNQHHDQADDGDREAAYIYVELEIARLRLRAQESQATKTILDLAAKKLDSLESTTKTSPQNINTVNAAYYKVSSEYFKFKADFSTYYRHSLLYLGCINVATELSLEEQQTRAYDLAIAALLGDKVFNFSELLMHPILSSLDNTAYTWLVSLVHALNSGDMDKFEALLPNLSKNPLLEKSLPFLRQKICLAALIEAVFRRPTSDRSLTFQTIANDTRLVPEEVEHLIMRAFSLDLIRGFIDQVSQTVVITWVQPRVMNMAQIASMRDRLVTWDADVNKLTSKMKNTSTEIWTGV